MFARVTLTVSDRSLSERFYDTVLEAIGVHRSGAGWNEFAIEPTDDAGAVTRGLHIGFGARSHDLVRAFWQAGIDAGFRDDGEPGPRPIYSPEYFGGFLLDPDGNSAEAAYHDTVREGGCIDHLWIRVADVAASKAFYEELGAQAGFRLTHDSAERASFTGGNGSFSVVVGEPTRNLAMAFPGPEPQRAADPDGNRVEIVAG